MSFFSVLTFAEIIEVPSSDRSSSLWWFRLFRLLNALVERSSKKQLQIGGVLCQNNQQCHCSKWADSSPQKEDICKHYQPLSQFGWLIRCHLWWLIFLHSTWLRATGVQGKEYRYWIALGGMVFDLWLPATFCTQLSTGQLPKANKDALCLVPHPSDRLCWRAFALCDKLKKGGLFCSLLSPLLVDI